MFESRQKRVVEILNEFTLLVCTYFAHLFSDLVFSPEQRYNTGCVYIGIISTNIIVQLALIITNSIIAFKLWCKKRTALKAVDKMKKQQRTAKVQPAETKNNAESKVVSLPDSSESDSPELLVGKDI